MGRSQADIAFTASAAVVACVCAAIGAPTAVMAVLGIALFVSPGYLLSQLLTGSRTGGLERAVVAAGLTLIVPILGGLLLYAVGVPLHRAGWLGLLAAVTLIADALLFLFRRTGRVSSSGWQPGRLRMPPRRPVIFAVVAVLIAAGALTLARIGVAIQPQPGFTQLWLSSHQQSERTATFGVSNDEGSTTSYRLVLLRNSRVSATWNFTLADNGTWQRTVPYTGASTLVANLYRLPDLTHRYRYVSTNGSKAAGS